jgi:pseudaminic acid cytidylyltransferase
MPRREDSVALIPARGGSKRLPRKNIIDFLGRPIIAYTIEAAQESGCFARVAVSTDDDEIAGIARRCGAEIALRQPELASDSATLIEVCLEFLDNEKGDGRDWLYLGCLYATAPLRNAQDVRATMSLLEPGRCAFTMAVTGYEHYAHQAMAMDKDGTLTPMWPDLVERRGSDLPPLRAGNGSTYGLEVAAFRRHKAFYGPGLRGHDMPRERSIDIDTQTDLDLALFCAQRIGMGRT